MPPSMLEHAKAIVTAIDGSLDSFEARTGSYTSRLILQWIMQANEGGPRRLLHIMALHLATLPDWDRVDRVVRLIRRSIAHTATLSTFNMVAAVDQTRESAWVRACF